jgi:hypothetical protein
MIAALTQKTYLHCAIAHKAHPASGRSLRAVIPSFRLKQLEDENAKLNKIVADLSLDREMLQDVIRRKL